jgi:hypothetical protein
MPKNKTKPTRVSVATYLASIKDDARRSDCRALVKIMTDATGHRPVMWGPSIVGFGRYHYRYDSGREGDSCLVGFSSGRGDISLYLFPVFPQKEALLEKLGKHRAGKGCVYIRRLEDVKVAVLEKMIAGSISEIVRRYGTGPGE